MKKTTCIAVIASSLLFGCAEKTELNIPSKTGISPVEPDEVTDTTLSINTSGYWDDGEIVSRFDCPDAVKFFPPVDIRSWYNIPIVNGRLPTYKETVTGRSIHMYTYKGKKDPTVKAFNITLPKLAYRLRAAPKMRHDPIHNKMVEDLEIVIVIQMVQTPKDTLVSYRYLTGGCGGSYLREFRFLTDKEVKEVTGE